MGGVLHIVLAYHSTVLVSLSVMDMLLCWSIMRTTYNSIKSCIFPHKPMYFTQLDDTSLRCRTKEGPKKLSQMVGI